MQMLTELYPHQRAAVDKLSRVKVGALYMGMGTGKTRTALELIRRRLDAGKISRVLWMCPYSVVPDMPDLLAEHVEGFMEVCRIDGIESLSSSLRIYQDLLAYVSAAPTYLIVDESLLVKNPTAYRTERIIDISKKCDYKLILNGTPISKNEGDLFAQWYILDWRILGYRSYWSFCANHLEFDPERHERVVRALNVEYLARKIAPYTFEMQKEDALDLPPKLPSVVYNFHLTDEQNEHYTEISDSLISIVDEQRPETIYRLFGALQAITSGFAIRLDGYHATRYRMYQPEDNPRIQALMDLLESKIGEEQAVIYCRYTQEILDIVAMLGERATPYYGEMSQAKRHESKIAFKSGKAQYFIANKSCAQFGLNLQFCRNEIFYNNDWDYATREQAEDRLHRIGQTREVRIFDLCATDTIDVSILDCLLRKWSLINAFKHEMRSNNSIQVALSDLIRGGAEKHGKNISQ